MTVHAEEERRAAGLCNPSSQAPPADRAQQMATLRGPQPGPLGVNAVGGIGLGEEDMGEEFDDRDVIDRCPWDTTLKFFDPRLEAAFVNTEHATWSRVDATSYFVYLLANPLKMMSWSTTCLFATCVHHGWMVSAMIATRVLSSRCKTSTWPYSSQKARVTFITWFRIFTCLMSMIVVAVEDSTHIFDDEKTHAKIVSRTPIAPLIFTSIAFWLPFRNICAVQAISTLVTAPWIWILASECKGNQPLAEAVRRVSVSTETIVFFAGMPAPSSINSSTSWWQVGSFYHILYGLILPLTACYLVEAWRRIRFIHERDASYTRRELTQFFWRSVQCVAFVDLIAIQLLWTILKELRV